MNEHMFGNEGLVDLLIQPKEELQGIEVALVVFPLERQVRYVVFAEKAYRSHGYGIGIPHQIILLLADKGVRHLDKLLEIPARHLLRHAVLGQLLFHTCQGQASIHGILVHKVHSACVKRRQFPYPGRGNDNDTPRSDVLPYMGNGLQGYVIIVVFYGNNNVKALHTSPVFPSRVLPSFPPSAPRCPGFPRSGAVWVRCSSHGG